MMKRVGNLLPKIADSDNLRLAFWKASIGKRHNNGVLAYQRNLEYNLDILRQQILSGNVEVGNYHYFKVFEPKERNICASAFSEQVLHHAIMNICHDYFETWQIKDSYASRIGKGIHKAVELANIYTLKYQWFLKLDVRKYFESVHHEVIQNQMSRMFKDSRLLSILNKIVASYEASPNRGLPIGNLTSQYLANHYLCPLDHFVKEEALIKPYVRYMDDMVLWSQDKAALKLALNAINTFLNEVLNCSLKPPVLNRCSTGLPFLGYHIFKNHRHLTQQSKQRFIRKFRIVDENYYTGIWSEKECQRSAQSLIAFTQFADAHSLRNAQLRHYHE